MSRKKSEPSRADRVIEFIEKLKITAGKDIGKPFRLREWQKRFIRDVFEPSKPCGARRVRRAILSMARKCGKTELAAALVLVFLIGPESEANGQIIAAANSRDQAGVLFDAVQRLVQAEPHLMALLKVVPSTKRIYVKRSDVRAKGSVFRAVSAEAANLHGLNPSMVIIDELAQAKSRELFDTLATAMGARAQPLMMVISTQSADPTHVLSEMIQDGLKDDDDTTVCHLFTAPEGCDLLDKESWYAANPALGDFLDIDAFEVDAQRAQRMPSEERNFRLLRLNQQVSAHSSLINQRDWRDCLSAEPFEFQKRERIFMGLDLSATNDLTALVAVSAGDASRVKAWFWKPEDLVVDHAKRDGFAYDVFAKNGRLETCPGRSVRHEFVAKKMIELALEYDVIGVAYDRWRIEDLLPHFDRLGFDVQIGRGHGLRLEPWGQGYKDMSPAIEAFENSVINSELKHDGHPILTFCVTNAYAKADETGARKLDKMASRFRIDGAVALAMALGLKARERALVVRRSPWEDENFQMSVV